MKTEVLAGVTYERDREGDCVLIVLPVVLDAMGLEQNQACRNLVFELVNAALTTCRDAVVYDLVPEEETEGGSEL